MRWLVPLFVLPCCTVDYSQLRGARVAAGDGGRGDALRGVDVSTGGPDAATSDVAVDADDPVRVEAGVDVALPDGRGMADGPAPGGEAGAERPPDLPPPPDVGPATPDMAVQAPDVSPDLFVDPSPDVAQDQAPDLPPDSPPEAPPCAAWPVPPTGINPCLVPAPTGALSLGAGTHVYHTDTGVLDGAAAPASVLDTARSPHARVVSVTGLVIGAGATLRVVGPHPVVFVVHGQAQVQGTIDVSAHLTGSAWSAGPGAETACGVGAGGVGDGSNNGAAGGGGAGFGQPGGSGGPGDQATAGAAGMMEGAATLSPLRGGCAGGRGGSGDAPNSGGLAGRGGGAIHIAARDGLTVSGSLRAGGGPGEGGKMADSGGGGGGSGGAVLLESMDVRIEVGAAICANGGGGGGGASDQPVSPGGDGGPGTCAATPAAGGTASGGGSPGGAGGYGSAPARAGSGGSEGGGGGGGGVGRIRVRAASAPTILGTVTPAPM